MNNSLSSWFGQVTTGHGFMILAPTLLAALGGELPWSAAAPLLLAGGLGLAWPENTALQSADAAAASDVATMVGAYMNKGSSGSKPPV